MSTLSHHGKPVVPKGNKKSGSQLEVLNRNTSQPRNPLVFADCPQPTHTYSHYNLCCSGCVWLDVPQRSKYCSLSRCAAYAVGWQTTESHFNAGPGLVLPVQQPVSGRVHPRFTEENIHVGCIDVASSEGDEKLPKDLALPSGNLV